MVCALATGFLKENSRVKEDTVMGVVFSGMFGLGIVLYAAVPTNLHLDHILFGDMLGVSWRDIAETAAVAVAVTAFLSLKWRDLLAASFDGQHARAIGLPTRLMAGLHLLKHMKGLSDDETCAAWLENPYFQAFCGETHFQHRLVFDRSSMTRWRQRIGAKDLEAVLAEHRRDRLAAEHDDRHRIHVGREQPGDGVGGAGARGHEHDPRAPRRARIAIRHVGGALFVPNQYVVNFV